MKKDRASLIQEKFGQPQIAPVTCGANQLDQPQLNLLVTGKTSTFSRTEDLIDQIQITVRHEVGHYLGLDEDDLERLGLA